MGREILFNQIKDSCSDYSTLSAKEKKDIDNSDEYLLGLTTATGKANPGNAKGNSGNASATTNATDDPNTDAGAVTNEDKEEGDNEEEEQEEEIKRLDGFYPSELSTG